MQRYRPPSLDLLCRQENELNQGRDHVASEPSSDVGGEIYEPLWERPASGQNGVAAPLTSPSGQGQSQAPPVPQRNASTFASPTSTTPRSRTHPLTSTTTNPPPHQATTVMLPPSYTESETQANSPSYSAGQGSNMMTSPVHPPPPGARAQGAGMTPTHQPLDYSGSFFDGATAASPPFSPPGGFGVGAGAGPFDPAGALPSKMMEAMGLSDSTSDDDPVFGWNAPPLSDQGAPPPYMPRSASNRGPQVSLKERQVEALKKEMEHAGGVKVVLRKLDCHHTVAWVECFGGVWIAGWNQKARPFLHNAFHVGDQIISINGQVIEGARMAHKLIKHSDDSAKITFILRRVPNARIFLLKRSEDGESLGIRRDGGTGEILDLEPFGVAANHGMPVKSPTHDRQALCNLYITEVNMRPVSLYFKGDEIEKRLNAVGKEISVLIHPSDFIHKMKELLKKNFKNYKDYVVQ